MGAGTQDLVRWDIGSCAGSPTAGGGGGGSQGSLITLGDVALPKSRRQGVALNVEEEGSGGQVVEDVHGGGLKAGLDMRVGVLVWGKG
jgi:hypothetical protein